MRHVIAAAALAAFLLLCGDATAFTLEEGKFHIVGDAQQSAIKLIFDSFVPETFPKNFASWGKNPGAFTAHQETILLFPKENKPKDAGNLVYIALANRRSYRDVGRVQVDEQPSGDSRGVYRDVKSIRVFDRNGAEIPISHEASAVFRCTIENESKNGHALILCIEAKERDGGILSRTLEIRTNYPPGKPKVPLGNCSGPNLVKNLDGKDSFRACGRAGFTPKAKSGSGKKKAPGEKTTGGPT